MPITFTTNDLLALLWSLVETLIILLLALAIARFTRRALLRLSTRKRINVNAGALLGNLLSVGIVALAVAVILPLFGVSWTTLLTVVGAIGLAVSLAFQDLLRNFIAGVYLLIERPFTLGDKIQIQTDPPITGTIQTIELRITNVRTEDGLLMVVPNSTLFTTPVTNYTAASEQRSVVRVATGGGSLEEARTRINQCLAGFAAVAQSPAPSITVEEASPTVLRLRIELWTPPADTATVMPALIGALRQSFPAADVAVGS